jgi:cellulose synthase/poly-beta-1,6-N-acetylglucosamine synthase-like glycosyltransferase
MSLLVYALFGLIIYTYIGYFALTYLMSLIIVRPIKKSAIKPKVALVIAAYNEEAGIEAKILNSLALNYPKDLLDIYIVSDGSTDKTDAIAHSYKDHGIQLIRVEGRVGKTEARNIALKQIQAPIILFSDATTEYDQDVIIHMVKNFTDPEVGMVTGHLRYKSDQNSSMGIGQKIFWQYETLLKNAQTRLGTLTGSIGCITAFRKEAYSDLPPNIIEDFTEPLMVIQKGYRVVFEPAAICYEMATEKSKQEWKMRVRVVRGGMTGLLFAKRILNPFKYPVASFQLISHKVLRWFMPLVALLLFVLNLLSLLLQPENNILLLLFLCQVLYYFIVIVAHAFERMGLKLKIFNIAYYFFIVNAAALVAIYKTLKEPLAATWETQREA